MTLPNPSCNCCECCILDDDFTGAALHPEWNAISGSITLDTGTNIATIASGSVISTTTALPSGSGNFSAVVKFTTSTTTIKFAYADANNHWQLDCTKATNPFTSATGLHLELYQVVGGTPEFIADRWSGDLTNHVIGICWYEGGRVSIGANGSPAAQMSWPNGITGGTSFRIETTSDIELSAPGLDNALFCRHFIDNPDCPCTATDSCMFCPSQWGDTIQVEVLTGLYTGTILTLDRNRSAVTNMRAEFSYWYWINAGDGVFTHYVEIDTCALGDGNSGHCTLGNCSSTTFRIGVDPPGGSMTRATQVVSDCDTETTWDVTVNGIDYRVTLL